MAAPSVSGGFTMLESCDTGAAGKAPIAPLAGSTVGTATTLGTTFGGGINGTGSSRISHNAATATLVGGIHALAVPVDLTPANRFLIIHHTTQDVSNISTTQGVGVVLNSSSLGSEEAVFILSGAERTNPALEGSIVNVNRSANAATYTGTFDPSDVTHVGIAASYPSSFKGTAFDSIGYVDPYAAINGTTGDRGNLETILSAIDSADAILNESPTNNMHHLFFPWGVGDGATLTYFEETLKVFEMVRDFDLTTFWGRAHLNDNDIGFEVNASASDNISFELCNWLSDTPFYWNSIGSTSATVSYTTCIIKNAGDLTIVNGHSFDGCTFDDCAEISATAPTLTNTTLKNATGAALSVGAAGATNMTSVTFSGNQTALKVDVVGSTTLDVTELTFDTSNTYYIEYTGTGTLTVTSPVTIPAGKLNASGGGTINVVSPTADLTVDVDQAGCQIHVYTTGTQTILDSEASAAQLVYTHSNETVDITVLKDGYIPYRQTGLVLSGNVGVDVQLVASREYDSGHGLTYTTDASWSRSLNQLTVPAWGVTGQAVFSLMLESFRTQASLYNTDFNLQMDGAGSLYLVDGAEGNTDSSIENLIECGCAYLDSSGVTTASWVGIKSVGTATGFTGEYQQVDGSGTTDARATGIFNELIKMYGDATHGNFDYTGHLVLKYQPNTYREARSDVLADYGISALNPTLYIVAMEPSSIDITAGDPAISITIVDHTAAPKVVGGKSFDYEIVDNGANNAETILREINYNLSQDATYQGKDPFNWPELVLQSGSSYETIYGIVEGDTGLHGVYVSRSGGDHPDFVRHQSNDGTYYVKPITANASISNIASGSRLRIYNETTATETYNDVPGTSYSDSYTEGTTYTAGDVISIYITQTSGTTAKLPFSTTAIASSTGWTVLAAQIDDEVYNQYGLNGSTITKFTADYVNDEVDLAVASNFAGDELYSWWAYNLTTSQGISDFFGGLTAQDAANLLINNSIVSIYLDNTTTTNVYQTDNIRVYRADGAYPVKNPTSGGGGIDVVWRDRVYIAETGVSGLTPTESSQLSEISSVNTKIGSPAVTVSDDIGALNDFDPVTDVVARVTLVDTTTTNTDMRGTDGANTIAPDNASIAAIQAKTDSLTFTKANELDSNLQSVNDVTVSGTGAAGDEWGPV